MVKLPEALPIRRIGGLYYTWMQYPNIQRCRSDNAQGASQVKTCYAQVGEVLSLSGSGSMVLDLWITTFAVPSSTMEPCTVWGNGLGVNDNDGPSNSI